MNPISLAEVAAMCGGTAPARAASIDIRRVSKDTRTLLPGDLYFALRGERFDGNRFAAEAARKGAVAAVLDDPAAAGDLPPEFVVIAVPDGLAALRRLAAEWRRRLAARVVCITGSNGKTSTKDFTAAVLGTRFPTTCTSGNLNNHIGLPLTILEAETGHAAAVWEIGMNHAGEIAPLAALARPEIGVITGIGVAHIENLGSRDAIAEEKGRLFEALGRDGVAILPQACDYADRLAGVTSARVVRVGGPDSSVRAEEIRPADGGSAFTLVAGGASASAWLPVPGSHMVSNALLATAVGVEFGLSAEDCAEGLREARVASGRLSRRLLRGVEFLDDSYNANPDSMEAALGVLAQWSASGRRIAVLGKMGELGSYADEGYRRVGTAAAGRADVLVTVGAEAEAMAAAAAAAGLRDIRSVATTTEAARLLGEMARPGDVVLVKGSRSARMEHILATF